MIKKTFKKWGILFGVMALIPLYAQPDSCTIETKNYNESQFEGDDFLFVDDSLLLGDSVRLNTDQVLDLENLVLGLDQPFFVDYLSEGAGASHLFGFFFLDFDTDKDGIPDFWETGDNDDLDGDGLANFEDLDDDADGIPDSIDVAPSGVNPMPAELFRNGTAAANNSLSGRAGTPDYWQFLPNSVIQGGIYDGYFEIPTTYLYIDNNTNQVPDVLEYDVGSDRIPPYVTDKGFASQHVSGSGFVGNAPDRGLLGNWSYQGTVGDTVDDQFHWFGSTIFYIADDDGGSDQTFWYLFRTPYGNTYRDSYGSTNGQPDYDIYGTTDISDSRIPERLKNVDGTAKQDNRGEEQWRYRWYRSNVSGAREMVFFLTVFYGSGGSNVNTYFSKSGFNPDPIPVVAGRNGNTTGDNFGGSSFNNWFPNHRNEGDHNSLVQNRFGLPFWRFVAPILPPLSPPVLNPLAALFGVDQEWIDEWENWNSDRLIIQYRALSDWFHATAVDANEIINGRYGIDMSAEGDSSLIRAINGKNAHMMAGAPARTKNAWLLGWEDLHGNDWNNDKDYEDVVFYVKREAGGQLQSLNVAEGLRDKFEDFSLSQITFTFKDNFMENWWGTEGLFVNYYYRLGNADEWIPLLGGRADRSPDLFQEASGGSTTSNGTEVTRSVTIQVENKKQEIYWKVEMATNNVDGNKPQVLDVDIEYQSLVHDFYFNSASLANSNVNYVAAFESPEVTWQESKNRGHLYARKTFEHGSPPTLVDVTIDPEVSPLTQPADPNILWDAGVSLKTQVEGSAPAASGRTIYTYIASSPNSTFGGALTRKEISQTSVDSAVQNAFNLSDNRDDNIFIDNYHEPEALITDHESASLWLQNWIHGFTNPLVVDGSLIDLGPEKEWILGGINRFSPVMYRSPGIPSWFEGSGVPVSTRRSYIQFLEDESQESSPTRILIGTENGFIHALDAGAWVGVHETGPPAGDPTGEEIEYDWADGHYADENYGTGNEIWAMLPGHLLEDIKYNYTGANTVTAKIDATSTIATVLDGNDWKRIAVFSQGFKGGTHRSRTGNVIWALDITNIDDPIPMWQRSDNQIQDQINPVSIGWMETGSGNPVWTVGYSSGGTPVTDRRPSFILVNAITGQRILRRTQGSPSSAGVDTMLGSPALVDTDGNGYFDHVFGATSEGRIFAFDTRTGQTRRTVVDDARFFLAPNVSVGADGVALITIPSGDNPLIYDESEYSQENFVNRVYVLTYDTIDRRWDSVGNIPLPPKHKAFSRPRLVGQQLVLGTTTGDTFNFCDFNQLDPGDLFLFDLSQVGVDADLVVQDRIENFGSILAPITIRGGRIFAHRNTNTGGDSNSEISVSSALGNSRGQAIQEKQLSPKAVGDIYGGVGMQDGLLKLKDPEETSPTSPSSTY